VGGVRARAGGARDEALARPAVLAVTVLVPLGRGAAAAEQSVDVDQRRAHAERRWIPPDAMIAVAAQDGYQDMDLAQEGARS
jgi:hypothetical protein